MDLQLRCDTQSREHLQNVANAAARIGALESDLRGAAAANLALTDAARVPQSLTDRDQVLSALKTESNGLYEQLRIKDVKIDADLTRFQGELRASQLKFTGADEARLKALSDCSEYRTLNVNINHELEETKVVVVQLKNNIETVHYTHMTLPTKKEE